VSMRSGDGNQHLVPFALYLTSDPVIKTLFFRWTWVLHPTKIESPETSVFPRENWDRTPHENSVTASRDSVQNGQNGEVCERAAADVIFTSDNDVYRDLKPSNVCRHVRNRVSSCYRIVLNPLNYMFYIGYVYAQLLVFLFTPYVA